MMQVGKGCKRIAYIRVSTAEQNEARQTEAMSTQHIDRTFMDKLSGKDTNRPQLQAALEFMREGDCLVVHSFDRLARNMRDLQNLIAELNGKKIAVEFIKENLTFTGEDSPMSKLMLSILGGVAEFERSLIRERQREGIAVASRVAPTAAGRSHSQPIRLRRSARERLLYPRTASSRRWLSPERLWRRSSTSRDRRSIKLSGPVTLSRPADLHTAMHSVANPALLLNAFKFWKMRHVIN